MNEFNNIYVGLDVHKETIAVAVARAGRGESEYHGEIAHSAAAAGKLLKRLSPNGEVLNVCYEAGPCGYGLHRQLTALGHECAVVAPSLIPRKAGERLKTDRRDALMLARLHRAGELTAVWVPDEEQESVRDLTRAREDMKSLELKARQRLSAFLLRHGKVYTGKSRWTQAHWRWLEGVKFDRPVQQLVLQEYIDTVKSSQRRVAELEGQMREALQGWSLGPVAEALMALRGVSLITAMTTIRAITPTATPAMDRYVMSEMKACFCLARRYRPPMKRSKDIGSVFSLVFSVWYCCRAFSIEHSASIFFPRARRPMAAPRAHIQGTRIPRREAYALCAATPVG